MTLTDTSITFNFGSEWGSGRVGTGQIEAGRSLVIRFSDVTAGLTAGDATFSTSSSARNGNLRPLGAQPTIDVGNILGTRTATIKAAEVATDARHYTRRSGQ